ncbi:alpha/beta hydrolase [Croceicoccus sp. F390]|uniref:Alpha/beta hydrolase n=1 Tax=Croceicoccus esteveae TaxID=3075597 RepID=A0ABU2ZIZ0_9SPHN|nr:alpha/beta hydrolase [Croceicoccus sp. F390]MDT0575372.1 alpha/beta hydrolase [Croceicoccus sp. F390]
MSPETLTFDGSGSLQLAAGSYGPHDGAKVLLIHGGGQTRWSWNDTAIHLAEAGYHAVTLDQRGHGDSAWSTTGNYHLDDFANDLRCVIAQLGGAPILVGASLGGLASLLALGEDPQAPSSGLVLVDIAPRMKRTGANRVVDFMRSTQDGFASLEEAGEAVARYNPNRKRPASAAGLGKNMRQGADGRYRWHWDPAFVAPREGWDPEAFERRLMTAAGRIAAPVQIVRGEHSDVVDAEALHELAQSLPMVDTVQIEDAGHMIVGDNNADFNAAILPFVTAHAARRQAAQ